MENFIRYAISPIAFVLLFILSIVVGSLFTAIGAISYVKLIVVNKRIGFS